MEKLTQAILQKFRRRLWPMNDEDTGAELRSTRSHPEMLKPKPNPFPENGGVGE